MVIVLKQIVITICEPCLNGEGEECHTPGCALWLHSVDLPFIPEMYTVIQEYPDMSDEAP